MGRVEEAGRLRRKEITSSLDRKTVEYVCFFLWEFKNVNRGTLRPEFKHEPASSPQVSKWI